MRGLIRLPASEGGGEGWEGEAPNDNQGSAFHDRLADA